MENINLEKNIWTSDDFEIMGWHDCYIYAMFLNPNYEFSIDLDYIFKWIDPHSSSGNFKFWISPCTLVFENIFDLKIEIEVVEPFRIQIDEIIRNKTDRQISKNYIGGIAPFHWIIETLQGEITFYSNGYNQFVRQRPKLLNKQFIGLNERNGISFEKSIFSLGS